MKPYQTALRIMTAFVLALLFLPALPARTVQAAVEQSATIPTTSCTGSGYMRSLTLTQFVPRNDDDYVGPVSLGFTINFFGTNYSDVYVDNNGRLTFGGGSGTYTPSGMDGLDLPTVAPFFADVDTRPEGNPNLVYFDQVTVDGHPAFAVHYEQVGYYSYELDKIDDFMVILINRSDRAAGDFDIEYNYGQIQWETGDVSGGSGGLGGTSAAIGYSDGTVGNVYFEAPGSLVPGSFLDSNSSTGAVHTSVNSTHCGQWIFPVLLGTPPGTEKWTVTSLDSIGCNNGDPEFTMNLSGVTWPNNLGMRTLVDAGGTRYMDETFAMHQDWVNGPHTWGLYYDNSGGTAATTNPWPIPNNTPIVVEFQLTDGVDGAPVYISVAAITKCNGGTLMDTFGDVLPAYWAESWIYRLAAAGVTNGCSLTPVLYCPEDSVTREQMAKFLEVGKHGAGYIPPAGTGAVFGDVPLSNWAVSWIEKLYADGITNGCSTSPLLYCPGDSVTRDQMAKFLLIAKHGYGYTPPAVGGSTGFGDVATSYWAAPWIKQLAAEGITSGCGGGNYCPGQVVTRAQMAKFLVLTFGLP